METNPHLADDLLDLIATTRSIHRYRFDPIPEHDLNRMLWTATRAPSGTNRQPFRFLVLRDGPRSRQARCLLGDSFRRGWAQKCLAEGWAIDQDNRGDTAAARMLHAMQTYVDNFEKIPAIVLACFVPYREPTLFEGASVFPACQNLLLAARILGYGACFSGWHGAVDRELKEILAIPDEVLVALTITIGRPAGAHGPVRRRPVGSLVFEEAWEQPAPWAEDPEGTRFTRGGPPKGVD